MLLYVSVGLTFVTILRWLVWRYNHFQMWRRLGVPGPRPNMITGNLHHLIPDPLTTIDKWFKQYGRTFGYFEGGKPVLISSDLDLIKQVLIKDFDKFTDRPVMMRSGLHGTKLADRNV